ncbi:MAG: transposase, partial [Xanthomonadales bacterium]|nr:transposase [Xanthomonadales bacterium]
MKQHQTGLGAKKLRRKHGTSDAIFDQWRSRYGGRDMSDTQRLKVLEAENAALTKMLAERVLAVATSRRCWKWEQANAMRSSEPA